MQKLIHVVLALLCSLLAAVSAASQTAPPAAMTVAVGYEQLDRFFKGLQSLQAEFTQTVQDSRGQVIDKSSGKLLIDKPGKFRWDYAKPNAQIIVCDGQRIWLYDPELEQVTIRRADLSLRGTPAMLLSGDGDIRDSFEVEHVEQRDGMTVINLAPKRADTDFKLLQVALHKDRLVAMSLTDKLAQTTLLEFMHLQRNARLAESQFVFTAPKGVDVVDNSGAGATGK